MRNNKIKEAIVKNAPEIVVESQNIKVSAKIITTKGSETHELKEQKLNTVTKDFDNTRIKPKPQEMFTKSLEEKIPPRRDIPQEELSEFLAEEIRHPSHVIAKNRNFNDISKVVDSHEKALHDLNASGHTREKDPQKYLYSIKKSMDYMYNPKNYHNSELRGHMIDKFSEIHSNYSSTDLPENLSCSAVTLADSIPITTKPGDVEYHPSLRYENANSFQHGSELTHARIISKETGRRIIVTGDHSFDDPELIKLIDNRPIVMPKRSTQTNYDYLIEHETLEGEKFWVPAESKARSANFLTKADAYHKEYDNLEYSNLGSVEEVEKKKLLMEFTTKAINKEQDNLNSSEAAEKINSLKKFSNTGNLNYLDNVDTAAKPTFNPPYEEPIEQ